MASNYRTSTGRPPAEGFVPKRWQVLILFVAVFFIALGVIAGTFTGDVLITLFHAAFIVPVLVPAAMVGLLITAPLKRARLFERSPWPDLLRLAVGTALGLGAMSVGTFFFGVFGWLHHDAPLVLPVIAAGAGFFHSRDFFRRFDRAPLTAPATRGDLLLLLAAVPLAVLLIATTFPPEMLWASEGGAYDVRAYHLPLPREYLVNNSLAPLHHNVYSFLPGNVEMLYLQLMCVVHLVDPSPDALLAIYPAQFLHAAMMLLAAIVVFLAPISIPRLGRCLVLLVFLGTPWILVTGSLAYNEAGMLLYGAMALAFAMLPVSRVSLITIGVSLGLAVGCKMTAGTMFAVPVAVIMLMQKRALPLVKVAAIALVVYAPWAIRAAAYTRNPVFPLATSLFGTGNWWTAAQGQRWDAGHRPAPGLASVGGRLSALAQESVVDPYWSYIPWGKESRLPHRPGLLWFAAGIALFFAATRGPQAWLLLAVMGAQILCWLMFTHLQARFLLPMLVPLAWLIGMGTVPLALPRAAIASLVAGHALLASLILLPELGLFGGSKEDLSQIIGTIPLHTIPPPAPGAPSQPGPICLVGENTPLLYQGEVFYATVFDTQPLVEALRAGGADAALRYLDKHEILYLGVNFSEIARLASTYGFEPGRAPVHGEALAAYMKELRALFQPLLDRLVLTPYESTPGTRYFLVASPAPLTVPATPATKAE